MEIHGLFKNIVYHRFEYSNTLLSKISLNRLRKEKYDFYFGVGGGGLQTRLIGWLLNNAKEKCLH